MMWQLQCYQCHRSFVADVHGRKMYRPVDYYGYDKKAALDPEHRFGGLTQTEIDEGKPITVQEPIWEMQQAPTKCPECRQGGGKRKKE